MYRLPTSILAATLCSAMAGVGLVADPTGTVTAEAAVWATAASSAAQIAAQNVFNRMTQAQRIGQLFMVGGPATGLTAATTSMISRYHVGNLILTGRTSAGAASVRSVTSASEALTSAAATAGVPLLIAADQEGGYVQVLQGPGFSRMPTALTQGSWPDSTLTSNAAVWSRQVLQAGVNVNLAPVMDTVSQGFAPLAGTTSSTATPPRRWQTRGQPSCAECVQLDWPRPSSTFPGSGVLRETPIRHGG